MDPMNKVTADVVRDAIRDKGMTQEAVRSRAGIKHTAWRNRIAGRRPFLVPELVRVARALGIRAGRLLDEADEAMEKAA